MKNDNARNKLPKGWIFVKLGDVFEFKYGKGLPETKRDTNGTVPVYGSGGIIGYHSTALIIRPCLIVGRKGTAGAVHISKIPSWAIDTTYYVCPPDEIDLSFGYYLLSNLNLGLLHKSTTIPGLNRNDAYALDIPICPFPEQRRIVAKIEELFTKLDAGVEALRKVKAELRRYRQSVLKHAFEGKLTAEWREANKDKIEPASVLLERIKEERKRALGKKYKELPPVDTSDLPELPEGWVWTTVGEIADNIHYGFTESAVLDKIGPKFLRITDIQNNTVSWDSVPYCKIGDGEKRKYLLKEGDLVFARTGATVGKSYLLTGKIPEAVFASYLMRIILNANVEKKYVYNFFQSTDYWLQIFEGQLGIGQPNVNAQILSRIKFPIAPEPEQKKIVEIIERHFSIADSLESVIEQNLKKSERLRQSILKKAFEGKLVPQDPTDEPAEKLLDRIKAERESLDVESKGTGTQ